MYANEEYLACVMFQMFSDFKVSDLCCHSSELVFVNVIFIQNVCSIVIA